MEMKASTVAYLVDTFSLLVEEKPFYTISVSQLTKKAVISRGTFYLYFEDMEEKLIKMTTIKNSWFILTKV